MSIYRFLWYNFWLHSHVYRSNPLDGNFVFSQAPLSTSTTISTFGSCTRSTHPHRLHSPTHPHTLSHSLILNRPPKHGSSNSLRSVHLRPLSRSGNSVRCPIWPLHRPPFPPLLLSMSFTADQTQIHTLSPDCSNNLHCRLQHSDSVYPGQEPR